MNIYNLFALIIVLTLPVYINCMNCDKEVEYFMPSRYLPQSPLHNYKSPISLALVRLHSTTPVEFEKINRETQKRVFELNNHASLCKNKKEITKIYNEINEYRAVRKVSSRNIKSLKENQGRVLTPERLAILFKIKKDDSPFIAEILSQQYKNISIQSPREEKRILLKHVRKEVYKLIENVKKTEQKIIDSEDIAYNPLIDLTTSLESKFDRIQKEIEALYILYHMKTGNILEIKSRHQSNKDRKTSCSPTPTPTIIIHDEFISSEPVTPIPFSSAAPDNAIHPMANK